MIYERSFEFRDDFVDSCFSDEHHDTMSVWLALSDDPDYQDAVVWFFDDGQYLKFDDCEVDEEC